ncbi:unnamed protein product, partial [Phaeothamnion confervicola]
FPLRSDGTRVLDQRQRPRTFVEESDDLSRSGKISLWPYNLRREAKDTTTIGAAKHQQELLRPQGPVYLPAKIRDISLSQHDASVGLSDDGQELGDSIAKLQCFTRRDSPLRQNVAVTATTASPQQREDRPLAEAKEARQSPSRSPSHSHAWETKEEMLARVAQSKAARKSSNSTATLLVQGDRTLCPLGCGDELRVRDVKAHEAKECEMRVISCPTGGCAAMFQARELPAHLAMECAAARRRG